MRTTLEIDDDILAIARQLAESNGVSLGRAVSTLARQGLAPRAHGKIRNGVRLFEPDPTAPKPTMDLVNRLRDEL